MKINPDEYSDLPRCPANPTSEQAGEFVFSQVVPPSENDRITEYRLEVDRKCPHGPYSETYAFKVLEDGSLALSQISYTPGVTCEDKHPN